MKRPDNGWSYSPIELEAIWNIPVDLDDVIKASEKVVAFHEKAATMKVTTRVGVIDDAHAATIIKLALVGEIVNDAPAGWCVRCQVQTPFDSDFCDPCLKLALGE